MGKQGYKNSNKYYSSYIYCSIFAPETMGVVHKTGSNSWLTCSYFIYNPNQRQEAWRFVSYMFLHASNQHIIFNLVIQLVVGKWNFICINQKIIRKL